MNKKIISNLMYQISYQVTIIVLPIISIPIVSKALGVEGIGRYNYVTSIVSYFILLSGLGLANYGIREIAIVKNDSNKLSQKFWTLELFNIIVAMTVILIYLIFIYILKYNMFFIVSGISLIATLFDISWFYYGIQDFKQVTIINILVKLGSFFCIIIFINNSNDLITYFFIQSLSILLSNLSLWIFLKNKVKWYRPKLRESINHFNPALKYFVGKASITIYTTLNKTLLGILASTVAVGLYTNSLQLITIFIAIIGTLDSVLLPHMTSLFTSDEKNKMINLMQNSINLQLFFSIPVMLGLIAINDKFVPWFFGDEFFYLKYTVPVLAPLVIIIPLGTSIVRQYLIPQNYIKEFNISVAVAAVLGLLINLILIPIVGLWGAVFSNLISELVVTSIRIINLKKNTDFKFFKREITLFFVSAIIMYFFVKKIAIGLDANYKTTFIQILFGAVIYFIATIAFKVNPIAKYFFKWRNKKSMLSKIKLLILDLGFFLLPKTTLKILFKRIFKKNLDLENPKLYSEKVQWLKFYYANNDLAILAGDKAGLHDYLAELNLENLSVNLLGVYDNIEQINWDSLPNQFVLKKSNSSGMNIIITDKSKADEMIIKKQMKKWMKKNFGIRGAEHHYLKMNSKIIIEEYLEGINTDVKVIFLNGLPRLVQINEWISNGVENYSGHQATIKIFTDLEGKIKIVIPDDSIKNTSISNTYTEKKYIDLPDDFELMIKYGEKIAKDFPLVRVDYFHANNKLYIGELTFTPGSGFTVLDDELQKELGDFLVLPKELL